MSYKIIKMAKKSKKRNSPTLNIHEVNKLLEQALQQSGMRNSMNIFNQWQILDRITQMSQQPMTVAFVVNTERDSL